MPRHTRLSRASGWFWNRKHTIFRYFHNPTVLQPVQTWANRPVQGDWGLNHGNGCPRCGYSADWCRSWQDCAGHADLQGCGLVLRSLVCDRGEDKGGCAPGFDGKTWLTHLASRCNPFCPRLPPGCPAVDASGFVDRVASLAFRACAWCFAARVQGRAS